MVPNAPEQPSNLPTNGEVEGCYDAEFGHIFIHTHARATRFLFRPARKEGVNGGLSVTAPVGYRLADVHEAIERLRPRLRRMLARDAQRTDALPPPPEPQSKAEQARRRQMLRRLAERDLPPMLRQLAQEHGFRVDEVQITVTRSRWGSCQRKRSGWFGGARYVIRLSVYLWLLPPHLQRFVMLHELTHTHHMDHSPAFHAELDALVGGQERALNRELKTYHTTTMQ